MIRLRTGLVTVTAIACSATGVALAGDGSPGKGDHGSERGKARVASATLRDASGAKVGRVWLHEKRRSDKVAVVVTARGLQPGFHGFHIHTTGRCEPPGFTTAGGHLNLTGAPHGSHTGDLPSLLVNADGTGMLATVTDRFSLADLRDADGSAVMVHSGPDNFANIPPRYGTPDQETLNTGDSGTRVACGVVR
jgi:Cu-Zn family superoxide dismutase